MEQKEEPNEEPRTPGGETGVADLRQPSVEEGEGSVEDANGVTSEDEGPTYERQQGTENPNTGGSTNPNNTMTHANSGNETEDED